MIIGEALGRLFNSMRVDISGLGKISVQYTYGNQDHLDKFIAMSDAENVVKYPLVFYVTNEYEEVNGWKTVDTDLVILMNTSADFLAKDRTSKTYTRFIEPVDNEVRRLINRSGYVHVMGDLATKWKRVDIPNFALEASNRLGVKTSDTSVVTDIVDARIIKVKLRIKTDCI